MSLYKGNNLISGVMPNSANQSLSNLDSAGQDIIDGKVSKSGDTMTGDLTIRPDSSPHINLQNSNFTKGTNPSGKIYWEYKAEDNNTSPAEWYTNRVSNLVTSVSPDGTVDIAMAAYQNNPNSSAAASIRTQITSAGVASCTFPNTTCCDGQWRALNQPIINSATSANGSTYLGPYTVNVPNDGHNYELLIEGQISTGSTIGNWVTLTIQTTATAIACVQVAAQRAAQIWSVGNCIIPITADRKLWVGRSTSQTGNIQKVTAVAYRRIGTNS